MLHTNITGLSVVVQHHIFGTGTQCFVSFLQTDMRTTTLGFLVTRMNFFTCHYVGKKFESSLASTSCFLSTLQTHLTASTVILTITDVHLRTFLPIFSQFEILITFANSFGSDFFADLLTSTFLFSDAWMN